MFPDALAVKVVIVGIAPEKVSTAFVPWVSVVIVEVASGKVRPVPVVRLFVTLLYVADFAV